MSKTYRKKEKNYLNKSYKKNKNYDKIKGRDVLKELEREVNNGTLEN